MTGCPACGSSDLSRITYPGMPQSTLKFDAIALCGICGLGVAEPRADQATLDAFYAGGGYWHAHGENASLSAHARNQCRHRLRRALQALEGRSPTRVLDVGAGEAWIGDAVAGAIYHYVEPDPQLRVRAAQRLGTAARGHGTLAEVAGPYDLVFVNQVLEHVAEPADFLSGIAAQLAPGGLLYVEVPNADYRFKSDVFPHTLFFTAASLARLAGQAGLATLACESFGALPETRPAPARLAGKVALRIGAALALEPLAAAGDDLLFGYAAGPDGIWLRWLGRKPAA